MLLLVLLIVKLALLVSAMLELFTLRTRIRAFVVAGPLTLQLSEPSLAVSLKRVVQDAPPSRDILHTGLVETF